MVLLKYLKILLDTDLKI